MRSSYSTAASPFPASVFAADTNRAVYGFRAGRRSSDRATSGSRLRRSGGRGEAARRRESRRQRPAAGDTGSAAEARHQLAMVRLRAVEHGRAGRARRRGAAAVRRTGRRPDHRRRDCQAAGLTKRSFSRYFPAKEDAVFGGVEGTGEQVVDDIRARPGDEDPWRSLHQVLRRWQQIHASEQALASLRLIESTTSLRARLHEKRAHWRQQVSDALRDRPDAGLDAFTADLLTNAATAALDTVSHEWLRSGGTADRAALLDRAFTLIRLAGPRTGTPRRPSRSWSRAGAD